MTLSKKEVFSLISFNYVGLTKHMGEFNSEEEALTHAEELQNKNDAAINYMIVAPVSTSRN